MGRGLGIREEWETLQEKDGCKKIKAFLETDGKIVSWCFLLPFRRIHQGRYLHLF